MLRSLGSVSESDPVSKSAAGGDAPGSAGAGGVGTGVGAGVGSPHVT